LHGKKNFFRQKKSFETIGKSNNYDEIENRLTGIFHYCSPFLLFSQEKNIRLPEPDTKEENLNGNTSAKITSRSFKNQAIDLQTLSDLLWAAYGINRPESGKTDCPSAMNVQELRFMYLHKKVFISMMPKKTSCYG
jgi:hypothetical protein